MEKAKLARAALIAAFILGLGTVVSSVAVAEDEFDGYETPMAEQMANLPDNFFELNVSTDIAVSPVDGFGGYETPMAEQMANLPNNFFKLNVPTNIEVSPVDGFGGYETPMAEQMNGYSDNHSYDASNITSVVPYLEESINIANRNLNKMEQFMQENGSKLSSFERQEYTAAMDIMRDTIEHSKQAIADRISLANEYEPVSAYSGGGGGGRGTQTITSKNEIAPIDGGIFESPGTAHYYPEPFKVAPSTQESAPAPSDHYKLIIPGVNDSGFKEVKPTQEATQESVYSKDWLRAPVEDVSNLFTGAPGNAYTSDWLRGPVETFFGPQKNTELPKEQIKVPSIM